MELIHQQNMNSSHDLKGWHQKRISEIATVIRGASPRPKGDKRYYGGEIPRLMVEDVTRDGKYVTPCVDFLTEEGSKKSRPCKEGTLTIVCSGTVGIPSFLRVDACIHDGFLGIININKEISKQYLYYQFVRLKEAFDKSATHGGIFTNLTTSGVKDFVVPFPKNLSEQTAIADALSNIDLLISQTEKLIGKKKAIKQGVMQELLKPKKGWVTKKLGQLLEYEQPTKYIVDSDKYSDNNPIPVLTAGKSFILGYTSEDYNVFENFPVIIFDDFTTSSQFVDFRFKVKSSAMKILKPKSTSVNLIFMFEILNNIHFPVADHKRHWIGEFQNIELTVPNEDEMNKLGSMIEEFQEEIQLIQSKLQKLKLQKQGMMQALLTGKIRLL